MSFPTTRPRRLRRSETWRRMARETSLSPADFIAPLFVREGEDLRNPIPTMPGCCQMSPDVAAEECRRLFDLGVPGVILFGIPKRKDAVGSEAYAENGVIPTAIRTIRKAVPDLSIWADICLCEYTDHGHCGVIRKDHSGGITVDNDKTLPLLAKAALAAALAGADTVAPSDMMDGRVGVIRKALDEAGRSDVVIVSYAAKYASAFYGPFRDAAGSAPKSGDRRSYQMDPANAREALKEVALDVEEGADVVMVKPALPYLDIIRQVRDRFSLPIAAYNVSGEYAMLQAAAANGWLDLDRVMIESLLSIKRAGADIILTYFAGEAAAALA